MINYSPEQLKQIEEDFILIDSNKDYSISLEKQIKDTFDMCLIKHSFGSFEKVLDIYKDSNFIQTGVARKLYILYTIQKNEEKSNETSFFLDNVFSHTEACDKYVYTTLMLRRLTSLLPPSAINEAIEYIISNKFSPSSIVQILSNELFEDFEDILQYIRTIMEPHWSFIQNAWFSMHICENFPTESNCLSAASYCLDGGNVNLAFKYLSKIENPSSDTLLLISDLQGVLNEQ